MCHACLQKVLTRQEVEGAHLHGGTMLGTSRGGAQTSHVFVLICTVLIHGIQGSLVQTIEFAHFGRMKGDTVGPPQSLQILLCSLHICHR